MSEAWSDIGVEWALLALRIAFIAVLYLFLIQVARLMLREIRVLAAPLRDAKTQAFIAGLRQKAKIEVLI